MTEVGESGEAITLVSSKGRFGTTHDGQQVYLYVSGGLPWSHLGYKRAHLLPDDASVAAVKRAHLIYNYCGAMALIAVSFFVYAAYLKWFRDSLPPVLEILVLCITVSLPLFIQNTLMKRTLAPYQLVDIERVPAKKDKS